jgi:MFS family permease
MATAPEDGGGIEIVHRRTTLVLSICFALSATSVALNVAVAPLAGLALAPRPGLATLPVSLFVIGIMTTSIPASLLMQRIGRRDGFLVGLLAGAIGAGSAVIALATGNFVLLCFGTMLMGVMNGTAQFYRFAAAEIAPPSFKARAISYVMAGGVVAGVLGPMLASGTVDLTPTSYLGNYATIVALYALVALILQWVKLPEVQEVEGARPARPLKFIVRDPGFTFAAVAAMAAYGIMSLLMTATPLAMRGDGHAFSSSAFVIQGHVVAMFLPSFFTGRLIEKFGIRRIIGAGIASMGLCVNIALLGQTVPHYWVALALLGLGWNLMFVAGTTALTKVHRTSERAKVQGLNDFLVFGSAAAGSFLAGYLIDSVGWRAVNFAVIPVLVVAVLVLLLSGRALTIKNRVKPVADLVSS